MSSQYSIHEARRNAVWNALSEASRVDVKADAAAKEILDKRNKEINKEYTDLIKPTGISADVENISVNLGVISTISDSTETLGQITDATKSGSIANPFLDKLKTGIAHFLSGLGKFADAIPPLRVALSGFIWMWELYKTYKTRAHENPTIERVLAVGTATVGFAFAIAMLATPIATTLILSAVAVGVGVIRDAYSFYQAQKELADARASVSLKEAKDELKKLDSEPSSATKMRRLFWEGEVQYEEQKINELRSARNKSLKTLTLTVVSLVGAVLLIPPNTIIGASILLGVLGYSSLDLLGKMGSWLLGKVFPARGQGVNADTAQRVGHQNEIGETEQHVHNATVDVAQALARNDNEHGIPSSINDKARAMLNQGYDAVPNLGSDMQKNDNSQAPQRPSVGSATNEKAKDDESESDGATPPRSTLK